MTVELRDYQSDVISRARGRIAQGCKRVLLQGATGSGKSVCAAEVVRCAVAKGRRVLVLAHRRRLIDQMAEHLLRWRIPSGVLMRGHPRDLSAPVQIGSRDTLLSRAVRNDWFVLPPADLVILDEAHHATADGYQTLLERYRNSVVLGLTATPARADGKGLGDYFDALECTVPTSRLVREGWLVPVRCYAPRAARRGLSGDPVSNWRTYALGRPTVLFAAKVEASLAACAAFCAAGVPAEHIDQHTPDDEREAVIGRLKCGWTRILCNVGIHTEGTDVPELSCCVLLRTAGSYVLYAQAVGRIMRSHPGKTDAVLIDHAGAVLRHGFPDEDVDWQLTTSETVDQRNRAARKAGKRRRPITCPQCAYVFSGTNVCPSCGKSLPRRLLPAQTRAELLAEVDRARTPEQKHEDRVRYWHSCLRVMAFRGQTAGAAAHMYRSRFGAWPDGSLPNYPRGVQWKQPVSALYPQYLGRQEEAV